MTDYPRCVICHGRAYYTNGTRCFRHRSYYLAGRVR